VKKVIVKHFMINCAGSDLAQFRINCEGSDRETFYDKLCKK